MNFLAGNDRPARILLLERDPAHSRRLAGLLAPAFAPAAEIVETDASPAACAALRAGRFDVMLIDLDSLAGETGDMQANLTRLCRIGSAGITIALSDDRSVSAAVAALQAGAHDYLPKPVNGSALAGRLEELGRRHGRATAVRVDPAHKGTGFHGFVGTSDCMLAIYEQIARIAPSDAPVFITGEAGSGKTLCARALHAAGRRADRPLVTVRCTALDCDRLEIELFGNGNEISGAATQADRGTLFIDEIDAMDNRSQIRLLHLLETGAGVPSGSATRQAAGVRLICATNRDPVDLIAEGRMREDLFYRLHVLPIHLPPLRHHRTDILPLARHFLAAAARREAKDFTGLRSDTADLLAAHRWPGNVRQLANLMHRIAVQQPGGEVLPDMVAAADIEGRAAMTPCRPLSATSCAPILPMWQHEQRIIEDTVAHFGGNIARAAAALEISPSTIYRKRQSWDRMTSGILGAA